MRRRARGLIPVVLAGLLTAGCDDGVVDLRDDMYAVHSLLIAGADTIRVRVTRNDPRVPLGLGEEGVGGAVVRLVHGGDTLRLQEVPTDPDVSPNPEAPSGAYAAVVPGGISSGESYELLVDWAGGSAHGTTRVLEPPQILAPEPWTRVELEEAVSIPVDVVAPSAAGGSLALEAEVLYRGGVAVEGVNCVFRSNPEPEPDLPPPPIEELTDIHVPLPSCWSWSPEGMQRTGWDSLDVQLIAVVYDSTYMSYAETLFEAGGAYLPYASVGIEGAMGFLASGARASVPMRLVNSRRIAE